MENKYFEMLVRRSNERRKGLSQDVHNRCDHYERCFETAVKTGDEVYIGQFHGKSISVRVMSEQD